MTVPAIPAHATGPSRSILFTGDLLPVKPVVLPAAWCDTQVVANLECAVTSGYERSAKAHNIVLPPTAIDNLAAANLAALSVANNHTLDAGSEGLTEMLALLRNTVPTLVYGTTETPFAELDFSNGRCAIIGCIERCRARGNRLFPEKYVLGLVREIANHYSAVFVTPHWGKEGEFASYPSPRQLKLAERWIEAGAAGVFGHHPHVLHGRSLVAGRPVYYSLGNLWFPHEESARYPATRVGLAVRLSLNGCALRHTEHFILATESGVEICADPDELLSCLEQFSEPLDARNWNTWRWARSVGMIYIDKSARSWSQRLSGPGRWKSRGLFLIWSLLPSTLLMRMGKRFRSAEAISNGNKLAKVASQMSNTGTLAHG